MRALIIAIICFSFSPIFAKQVPIDKAASSVEWLGQKKLPGDDHKGTVTIKKGTINVDDKMNLIGGTLIIDMTTIKNKDLTGKWKKKLEDHLNSEEFFHVSKHPEAHFKITKVEPTRSNISKVTGNLTLRGQTHTETFDIVLEKKGKVIIASGEIEINRYKYGVTYNSEAHILKKALNIAKDKVIKDKIKLTLKLKSQKI